jgi:hypothetical protein
MFATDPRTREVAASMQELAMQRVQNAIENNEEGIRAVFGTKRSDSGGEFHFTFPSEVTMLNVRDEEWLEQIAQAKFEVQIKFMVYLAKDVGRKGAEVIARAVVLDEDVKLSVVDVRDLRTGRLVRLKGDGDDGMGGGDSSGIVRGEGEGKTIDATSWTSK